MCHYIQISKSNYGQVFMCTGSGKIAMSYKTIAKTYTPESFWEFKNAIDSLQVEDYFDKFCREEKIYLKTGCKSILFSFSKGEILELRILLEQACFQYALVTYHKNNQN
ncbi:MAG: DUF6686 family protein [Cytophagaceae bacterium]